jgi:hypothetical protein
MLKGMLAVPTGLTRVEARRAGRRSSSLGRPHDPCRAADDRRRQREQGRDAREARRFGSRPASHDRPAVRRLERRFHFGFGQTRAGRFGYRHEGEHPRPVRLEGTFQPNLVVVGHQSPNVVEACAAVKLVLDPADRINLKWSRSSLK